MKQKVTVLLSLASLLALTPLSTAFAQTGKQTGTGTAVFQSGAATGTSSTSTSAAGNAGTSSDAKVEGKGNTSPTVTGTETGSSDVKTGAVKGEGLNSETAKGAGTTTSSDVKTGAAKGEGLNSETAKGAGTTTSSDVKTGAAKGEGLNSETAKGAGTTTSSDVKTGAVTGEGLNSETAKGAGTTTSSDVKTDATTGKNSNVKNDSELRLGSENKAFVSDFQNKSFDTNFEQVTALSQSVGDFLSKDPAAYQKYVKEQQAENELFVVKKGADYQRTVDGFKQSLKTDPENNNLYVELALTYLDAGDLKNAEEIAKQLDEKAPDSYLSLIVQADLADKQGKSTEKQLYLKKAVEKNPTSSVAQYKLGEELAQAGKYNEAAAYLLTAAALNPKNGNVFEQLNKVFVQTKTPELKTFVNGVVPKFNVKPFIENNNTLVPVRAISEALGANVGWNGEKQQVTIQRGNKTIQLTLDSSKAIVNGQEITINTPAKSVNGSTVLPLRFISESLGAKVEWKAESQMIVISE